MKYISIFFVIIFSLSVSVYSEEVTLANGDWEPYLSEKLPHYGYASHLVSEAFNVMGVSVKYEFYPWARAESMVEDGAIDGSVVWSTTTERKKFAYFSEPFIADDEVLFHLSNHPMEWNTFEDLAGLEIGVPLGSKIGAWEEPVESKIVKLVLTPTIETGFLQLLKGRIDGFPLIKSVGYHLIRTKLTQDEKKQITHASKIVERSEYRLMLSNKIEKNANLIDQFNQGLKILKENGRLDAMEKNFYAGKYD